MSSVSWTCLCPSSSPTTGDGGGRLSPAADRFSLREKRGDPIRSQPSDLPALFTQAAEVIALATARPRTTMATAESCTGGLLGAALTAIPGSSATYLGGVVAYSNFVKSRLLGVPEGTIARWGAVSPQVASSMATGVRGLLSSDIGIGITGVAGPTDSGSRPSGLTYVAVASSSYTTIVRLTEDRGRHGNRTGAVQVALELLLKALAPLSGPQ